jgi:hypothetical protein
VHDKHTSAAMLAEMLAANDRQVTLFVIHSAICVIKFILTQHGFEVLIRMINRNGVWFV